MRPTFYFRTALQRNYAVYLNTLLYLQNNEFTVGFFVYELSQPCLPLLEQEMGALGRTVFFKLSGIANPLGFLITDTHLFPKTNWTWGNN
jgi:hypothetical protein